MMKIKTILLLFVIFFTYSQAESQAVKSIMTPSGWKDNKTLLLNDVKGFRRAIFEYSTETGDTVSVPLPAVDSGDLLRKHKKDGDLNHTFSPDKKWIAFTRGNDLYTIDTETGQEIRHTNDGSDLILNGYASWVYYEEIFGRSTNYKAFWWSPDSRQLLFYRFDQTKVPLFPIFDFFGKHGSLNETRYPKAGDTNPEVKIFIAQAEGGLLTKVKTESEADQYFGSPIWRTDSKGLIIQWMDRAQENFRLLMADPVSGDVKDIYSEHQSTWTEWVEEYIQGENGLYIVRDKDLWENVYFVDYQGTNQIKLTEGKQWSTKIISLDEKNGRLFYTSRRESTLRNDFYCVTWKKEYKSPGIMRLSLGDYNYASVMISPSADKFVSLISTSSIPPRLALIDIDWKKGTGKNLKVIFDSMGDKEEFGKLLLPEIVHIFTTDGYKLPAAVRWPQNMDRTRKYPVLFYVYGGPNSSNVMDIWRNSSQSLQLLSKEGVIQVHIDNRSSGHCGKEGMNFVHRCLGKYEIQDFVQWAQYFKAMPFVDGTRIGITGYSFGGTMTALALTEGTEYFRYGIAGGGVYDWQLYDSHYTERYMDTPGENPDGYFKAAVINKAELYKDKEGSLLMLNHGSSDDNVHLQNTIQLVDALQKSLKHFELMIYPGGLHGYRGYQGQHSVNEEIGFWRKTLLSK